MTPAYPEPVDRQFRVIRGELEPMDWPPLQIEPARHDYRIAFSVEPERCYLLVTERGTAELVPERVCGEWPASEPARGFFCQFAPDVALELKDVQTLHAHIGCAQYPSGWSATPWRSHADLPTLRRMLRRELREFHGEPTLL